MLNLKQVNVDWMEPSPGARWRAGLGPTQAAPRQTGCFSGVGELGSQPDPTTGCTGCNVWLQLSSPQSRLQVFRCKQVAGVPPPREAVLGGLPDLARYGHCSSPPECWV